MIAVLESHGARRIADVRCDTGILANRIQRELHPDEAYGLDVSEGMIDEARQRFSLVQWCISPAEQLPFTDGTLNGVVTTSAFQFFNQAAALQEFYRVVAPQGLAIVAVVSPSAL
ncbi:methyltransferase domain-containing protein [Mycobacterium sp. CVI_P3]|uniref:Methyltransferase domain-containing protein n=1 Tax=Mycobacterium pinniadriaticum TaxID=2994102 RepID=A0ABT3SF47_9MYCO|nr:methyltransferase domain-containing protein [Mycobacterium pinniadriaticum]MCX2931269.1 methyltransferase domain-containing protein [Mycobacterium pinniadriaticum]MCX2937507.1 methyltransferase domain-containing protein [Mycobacterium pinniadriaticum]